MCDPDSSVFIFAGQMGVLLFGLSYRFIPTAWCPVSHPVSTTWWSFRITRGRCVLRCLLIELR